MKDHWIFLMIVVGAVIIAWYHYGKIQAQNSASK